MKVNKTLVKTKKDFLNIIYFTNITINYYEKCSYVSLK